MLLAAGAGAAVYGQEADPDQSLRINLGQEPPTLDPNTVSWDYSIAVIHQMFEGLVKLDKDLGVVPAVAAELPTVANGGISADGKTYTFKLRNDAKYSDGVPVKAKDFEYSLKRTLDPALAADYASFYYSVVGAEEYNTSKETDPAKLEELRAAVGIKALDDLTLQVNLTQPRGSFLALACLWPMFPVREDMVSANSTPENPDRWATDPATLIGNGPFKMTEWVHQDHITLVPNEYYFDTPPKLQKITFYMVGDLQAEYAAYLNDERDIATVPLTMIDQIRRDPTLSQQLKVFPLLSTQSVQFNNSKPPFNNAKVRRAFAQAIDTDTLSSAVLKGAGQPAYSWIPPGMPGYQPDLGKEYAFNPGAARQALADAGYPNGQGLPKVTLSYGLRGYNPQIAPFLQEQWKRNLGVDVALEPMESKAFNQFMNKLQQQAGIMGWGADYPDPDNWLPELFGTGAGNNKTAYSNPALDQLMKWAAGESDPDRRLQMWADAQRIVVDDAPMAFMFHQVAYRLVKPWVKDAYFNGMDFLGAPGGRSYFQTWISKKQ